MGALYRHPVRIYWEDTDAGGVVFYANYLKYFERARTEWLRTLGLAQQAFRAQTGTIFVVTESSLRHLAPARLDDLLGITVAPEQAGGASLWLRQQAWCDDRLLCEGRVRVACVDDQTFKPRRLPPPLRQQLQHLQDSPP